MKSGLSLASFKKVKESQNHAILRHPDGHQIQIDKSKLSPKLKADLAKLPQHFADAGEVQDPNAAPEVPQDQGLASKVGNFFQNFTMGNANPQPIQGMQPQAPTQPNAPMPAEGSPQASAPLGYDVNKLAQPKQQNQGQPSIAQLSSDSVANLNQGYNQIEQGIQQKQQAEMDQGKAEQVALAAHQQQLQDLHNDFQQKSQELDQETTQAAKEASLGHIDPSHWFNEKSVPGKAATAIGLILGGIGGGLLGTENPALKVIQSNIDRDVQAQMANQNIKENVFNNYLKLTKNRQDAMALTKAFYIDMTSNQIAQAAAAAKTPMAQANAQQALGQLKLQKQQTLSPMAFRASVMNHVSQNDGQTNPTIQAMAAGAIQDPKEKEAAQKEVAKFQEVNSLYNDTLATYNHLKQVGLGGHLSPADRTSAIDSLSGRIMKAAEGRINADFAKQQAEALLPTGFYESKSTENNKLKRIHDFFSSYVQTPVMDGNYGAGILKLPPLPAMENTQAPKSYASKAPVRNASPSGVAQR